MERPYIAYEKNMIIDLGLIDYEEACAVQKELIGQRKGGAIGDSVIFAEHRAVFTIGRTGRRENLLEDETVLNSNGIKVVTTDRGGDITFHGPGQLVVYPIIDLRPRGRDIHRYLRDIEEVAIRYLREYGIFAQRHAGRTGVWVAGRKMASIGIGVSGWVTFHGLSLNVDCDLNFFKMIHPCGMKAVEMTSLAAILKRSVSMKSAKADICPHLCHIFGVREDEYSRRHIQTAACLA